ncbi:DUF4386 domain-containing protein [Tsukamurella soli]|uniref:DUF4386 domain-containing protein n=1 Tax=Tsukamurella soli TaxID=644556 RepID=A0ABP8JXD7_9ACTN
MNDIQASVRSRRRPDGPPAGVLALITLAATIASVIAHANDSDRWQGVFVFAASVPLGIYAATMYARLLRLGIRVPGPNISFFGGMTASILGAASGLVSWAQSRADALPVVVDHLMTDIGFALGGVGMVGGLGLLIAGIAVPSIILRLVPRWLAWSGLVLAVIGEVSFLALVWSGFDALLPIARFVGLIWLAIVGFRLPRSRHDVPARWSRRA